MRSLADRGKLFHMDDFDMRATDKYAFEAFNFNMDEISAAIGISVLNKLPSIVKKRRELVYLLSDELRDRTKIFRSFYDKGELERSSPFFFTVRITKDKLVNADLTAIRDLLKKNNNIPVNADYRDFVYLWKWLPSERVSFAPQVNSMKHRDHI